METILEGAADLDIDQRSPEDKPPTFMKNFSSEARVQPPHHAHEYVQVSDEPSELTVEQELAALEDEVAKRQQRIAELTQEKVFSADKIAHKAIGDLATTAGGAASFGKTSAGVKAVFAGYSKRSEANSGTRGTEHQAGYARKSAEAGR